MTRYRCLSGPHGLSRRVQKIVPPPEYEPRTVEPVASRCTDFDIPPPYVRLYVTEIQGYYFISPIPFVTSRLYGIVRVGTRGSELRSIR
jgi:hypothetical protein